VSNARATSPGPPPPGHRRRHSDQRGEVPSITSAPEPLADDQARRTKRYLIQMGVRLVFFVVAVSIFAGRWAPLWVMWALMAAAVVLPYSAVLFANAGRDRVSYDTSPVTDRPRSTLAAAPSAAPDPERPAPAEPSAWTPADGHEGHDVVEHQDLEHQDLEHQDDATDDDHDAKER
jgi:hypothetical protein